MPYVLDITQSIKQYKFDIVPLQVLGGAPGQAAGEKNGFLLMSKRKRNLSLGANIALMEGHSKWSGPRQRKPSIAWWMRVQRGTSRSPWTAEHRDRRPLEKQSTNRTGF